MEDILKMENISKNFYGVKLFNPFSYFWTFLCLILRLKMR